jgi:hypothetical protein
MDASAGRATLAFGDRVKSWRGFQRRRQATALHGASRRPSLPRVMTTTCKSSGCGRGTLHPRLAYRVLDRCEGKRIGMGLQLLYYSGGNPDFRELGLQQGKPADGGEIGERRGVTDGAHRQDLARDLPPCSAVRCPAVREGQQRRRGKARLVHSPCQREGFLAHKGRRQVRPANAARPRRPEALGSWSRTRESQDELSYSRATLRIVPILVIFYRGWRRHNRTMSAAPSETNTTSSVDDLDVETLSL